ncbi:MAG: SDR family oxidoreductase [Flavobacteriaceae bacterium]|nr:SDR family oxidoreductase [Flavobacteriaceae bacterium]
MTETIGIIGCGWLGTPLARHFLAKGYQVKGTTTSKDKLPGLEALGISAYLVVLDSDGASGDLDRFLGAIDYLVINVPPRMRKKDAEPFLPKIEFLLKALEGTDIGRIVFISSTSVYGMATGNITEKTPPEPKTVSAQQLLASEGVMRSHSNLTTIIRFGGLIGPNRHPITMLSGRTLDNGNDLVNLIHLDDCIMMIASVIENSLWGELFNGVYPYHPTKQDYYTQMAQKRQLAPPRYTIPEGPQAVKKIISERFSVQVGPLETSIVD